MAYFQNSVLKKHLNNLDDKSVIDAFKNFTTYFHNKDIQRNVRNAKEEQFQEGFLRELFVNVLGYKLNPQADFNLTTEFKNEVGSKKADGAILKDNKAICVIELKSTDVKNLDKINSQAFNYKNNQRGCIYVVTSNFEKLRFFIHDSVSHIEFNLFNLTFSDFQVLWLCLNSDNLLGGLALKIKEESLLEEDKITKQLYKDYAAFRNDLWQNMVSNNESQNRLLLFKKTQKLLDRFLFIFFAEDAGLLPPNSISRIIERWVVLKAEDAYKPLYEIFKQYFGYINKGRQGQKSTDDIFAYNGGLFVPDELLDNILLDDEILHTHVMKLTKYDFQSEVDVNILGHIFENSLNEIENITSEIEGKLIDKSKSKRKTDGVFYTPKYITKYMVENSLGKLCRNKKASLRIIDEDYAKGRRNRQATTIKKLDENLQLYRTWLLNVAICDPACGSGAFLNQALEFLIDEHSYIDELHAQLFGASIIFQDVSNHILENNIFGVDLNEESVEIAKLSLWLRTAQRGRKLTTLNNNIKCGNSLIDDQSIAGEKAFNWQIEFPRVFEKGGFDIILGNPPYGILIDKKSQEFYAKNFPLTQYKTNLYILFIERMLQIFKNGIVHFIIPKSLLFNTYYEAIRRELLSKTEINEIYTITEKVFEDAEVGSSLMIQFTIKKTIDTGNRVYLAVADKIENFVTHHGVVENLVTQDFFLSMPNCEISVVSSESNSILKKLNKLKVIRDYYTLKNGLNPGNIKHILISNTKDSMLHKPIIWGREISKYHIRWEGQYINYDPTIIDRVTIQDIKSKDGMNKQDRIDFALRNSNMFETEKIVVRKTGDSIIASYDDKNFYFDTLVHGIYKKEVDYDLKPLLAIINSKAATKFYRMLHDIKGKVFAKISLDNLGTFPIPSGLVLEAANLERLVDALLQKKSLLSDHANKFLKLVQSKFEIDQPTNKMRNWTELSFKSFIDELTAYKIQLNLSMQAEWMGFFNEQQRIAHVIKHEIVSIDQELDKLVFQLYGLTNDEIDLIEKSC